MRLEGKVAIVTGAASGFGEGIARLFANEGASVVVTDINDEVGESVASSIADDGGKARYVHCDVTSRADVAEAVTAAQSSFGPLTTMVNNAGMPQRNQPMTEVEELALQSGMRTMLADGLDKALSGMTTVDEVLRVIR